METDRQTAMDLERDIVAFQRREILLLQSERFDEWLELLTDDISYWMPMVVNTTRRENIERNREDLSYYDEDMPSLRLRTKRLASTLAWSEDPKARRRYFVQLLSIEAAPDQPDELDVNSNIQVYMSRGEKQESHFVGGREDRLRNVGGEWKIARRKVIIDRTIVVDRFLNTLF